MADASTVEAKLDGLNPETRQPWPYRIVNFFTEWTGAGQYFPPEGPNTSSSIEDQIVTLAKVLTRRYKGQDVFDLAVANNQLLTQLAADVAAVKVKLGA